ncbi:MAG: translocation/assembly module TamB domain-containing protein [Kofleriaceae bacterium]
MVLLSSTAFAFLRIRLEGPDLADKIASVLNKRMRGRIEVGSVEWPTGALKTVATGGWVPVTVRDVKVWDDCVLSAEISAGDPEGFRTGDPNEDCTPDDRPDPNPVPGAKPRKPRKLLISAPLLTAEIDIHALMFGHHDFVFRNLWVHGGEALLEQTREPYPLHAYDRTIVSIVTAFYPRMKAGFRAGIYADSPPPIFDLRDIHIEHLNLTVHMAPYTNKNGTIGFGMTARLEDVNADAASTGITGVSAALHQIAQGRDPVLAMAPVFKSHDDNYLHMDATDPLIAKFYVRLALRGGHGRVRVFDEGPRGSFQLPIAGGVRSLNDEWTKGRKAMYDIELSEVVLDRLAQMPTEWSHKDYIANTLELDLRAHTLPCKGGDKGRGRDVDGADIHISGELENYWDRPYDGAWNLALELANLGPTLHTCIKSKMGGDNLGGRITLTGPFIASPKVTLDLHGLDYDLPLTSKAEPLHLTLAEVHGVVDLVNDQGSIEKTKAQIRGGKEPGEVMVSATFALKPYNAKASIDIVKPIDIGRFLPGRISTSVGRYLGGKLTAMGDVDKGFALEDFDLTLGPTPTSKLVRVHRGRIFTENDFDTIGIQRVAIEAGRSHAVFDGLVDAVKATLSITIDGDFPDLDVWLRRFGLPQFAKSAGGGQIVINGPIKSPTVGVRLNLGGVPCMDNLTLDAEVKDQIATIHHVSSTGLGGQLDGNGVVSLATPKVIQKFHLEGRKLDAARLCGLAGIVSGTLDTVDVDVKRTTIVPNRSALDWLPTLTAKLQATHLTVLDDPISNLSLCVNGSEDAKCGADRAHLAADDPRQCSDAKARGGACVVAAAQRDRGGQFAAMIIDVPALRSGRNQIARHLGGTVAIEDVPLTVIDQFVGKGVLGGLFSATLHLQGTGNAPQAEGTLWLIRSWLKHAFVGDGQMQITPIMVGKMPSLFVRGTLLVGQVTISGTVGTVAPYPVDLSLTARRVEADPFIDLGKLLGLPTPVQAWASGTITVRTELAPLHGKKAAPEAWVELTELEAIIDQRSRDGRLTPLRFALRSRGDDAYAMSLHVTPQTIELACRDATMPTGQKPCSAQLDTPAGVVSIEGGATYAGMNLHATGTLVLEKLAGLLENQLDGISGSLSLDARLLGTFSQPRYKVELVVGNEIHVRPSGVDTVFTVKQDGQLLLSNGTLGFNGLVIAVQDDRAQQRGELNVRGTVTLEGLKPASWGVLIDGKIAGKMLLALAPSSVAQASGLARIDGALTLFGKGELPEVTGTITFDPEPGEKRPAPFTISPRGMRREVNLIAGSIDILTRLAGEHRTYELAINDNPLTASIDGEGRITNVRGDLVLRDGTPQSARIDLDAENLPYKRAGVLDLLFSAKDISLELPSADAVWIARGNVSIVSGEYTNNFEIQSLRPTAQTIAPARPFWDEYPAIGNADLSLTLDVRKFAVNNNLTPKPIELEGPRIYITGSPRDLRLSGSIRVQRGDFKFPGTRAAFESTTGSIDFSENNKATNPHLDITSTANYQDLSGQLHIITLTINGTLDQPLWDLKTSTGYNKSQTLALLFLGRNPEQLRRSLGDQAAGSNPQVVETSTNPSAGFADQIVKDLAGQWVSDLLGDSLKKLVHLDVLRFEVGFGSIGVTAKMKLLENLTIGGEVEQTTIGRSQNVTLEVKTPFHPLRRFTGDRVTLEGVYLGKNYNDPAELDVQDVQGRFVYHLIIP